MKKDKLISLREEIDAIDKAVLKLLKDRFKVAKKIAQYKIKKELPLYQKARWSALLSDRLKRGKKHGFSAHFTRSLFKLIHSESLQIQKHLLSGKK
jgi:chorismate mutase